MKKEKVTQGQEKKPVLYVSEEEHEKIPKDTVLMKIWASGERSQKQLRFEDTAIHCGVADLPIAFTTIRRRPTYMRTVAVRKNRGSGKKKDKRKNSSIQDLGERAERYDFLNSLARAPAEITFGQVANCDIDSIIKQLLSIGAKRRNKSAVDIANEQQKDVLPPNRHQVVQLTVYSESVFALLGSGAISNVMYDGLANKLKSSLSSTERRIIVADGSTGGCKWIGTDIPVGFGKMVIRLKFMVIKSVPYD